MHFAYIGIIAYVMVTKSMGMPMTEDEQQIDNDWFGDDPNLETGDNFEGDIMLPFTRNGIVNPTQRWPGAVIPYVLSEDYTEEDKALIMEAIADYDKFTCLRWIPKTTEKDFVSITKEDTGCWSYVGRVGGQQTLNLQIPGCTRKGTRIHEMMHAAGFWHEQSRTDRTDFIKINFQNIYPDKFSQFRILSSTVSNPLGVTYDYGSVMHYPRTAFSKNRRPTISALKPLQGKVMGQRIGFAPSDYWKINRMYNCVNYPQGP